MGQFVCPACGAINRAPDSRDPLAARCGRCAAPLFRGLPIDIDAGGLALHRASTKGAAVLVDVGAPWCAPCRAMAPNFAAAASALEPGVRLLKLNSEAEPQAAAALGVSSLLLLFREGQVVDRSAGLLTTSQIVAWTRQALARPHGRA